MRAFLMICVFVAMRYVAADVSHLSMRYLPPTMMKMMSNDGNGHFPQMHGNGKTTTTIEKQILQELPEQIEYAENEQHFGGADMTMMMMHNDLMMMPMAMPADEMLPPPANAPVMHYLPPKQDAQEMMAQMPAEKYLPPMPEMHQNFQQPEMHTVEQQQMMELEPEPAHMLTPNGYQYKTGSAFPTPVARAVAMKHRFRLRQ